MVTLHIPKGVYYNAETSNFYDAKTGKGMGQEFFDQWYKFRAYFNGSAAAALRAI